jgi:M6 family metalloprotease-like protein
MVWGRTRLIFLGVAAIGLGSCGSEPTAPTGPGQFQVEVRGGYDDDAAIALELIGSGINDLTAIKGELYFNNLGPITHVVLVLSEPGSISFLVDVDDVGEPPTVRVIEVADANNEMRASTTSYTVNLLQSSLAPTEIWTQNAPFTDRAGFRPLPQAYYELVQSQPDAFQLRRGWIQRVANVVQAKQAVTGTLPLVVIPALFADSPEPQFTSSEIQRVLFDGPSDNGTVTEFYDEASGGRFNVRGATLPWVRTSITLDSAVGDSYGLLQNTGTGSYLLEALLLADPGIDFGQYDNDGPDGVPNSGDDDGYVDAVAFEFLEVSASCGGPGIWPHRWVVGGWSDIDSVFITDDLQHDGVNHVRVDDYIIQSAAQCNGTDIQPAGTIAHELGHVLGLPDLYDNTGGLLPEQRLWVVGCWSLMAAGSWGCGTSNSSAWVRPTHFGAWEKEQLGWLAEIETIDDAMSSDYTLEPVIGSQNVLKIPLEFGDEPDTNEYFLVEYRKKQGFDLDLPSSGVLIYHVDPTVPGNQPGSSVPPWHKVRLEEADGNGSLLLSFPDGGNRGEPGDAWGALGTGRFTHVTEPATKLNSGSYAGVRFYEIALEGDVAHLTISRIPFPLSRLLAQFLVYLGEPLTAEERERFDSAGNDNGRYDVGDFRVYLKPYMERQ